MHDANEMECLIFENAIKNILLGKVTKSGVSDANNKLIITIFQMWGHIDPIRSGIGLSIIHQKTNFHFPYVRFLLLRRVSFFYIYCLFISVGLLHFVMLFEQIEFSHYKSNIIFRSSSFIKQLISA